MLRFKNLQKRFFQKVEALFLLVLAFNVSLSAIHPTYAQAEELGGIGIYDAALQEIIRERPYVLHTLCADEYDDNPYAIGVRGGLDFNDWVLSVFYEDELYYTLAKLWYDVDQTVSFAHLKMLFQELGIMIFTDNDVSEWKAAINAKQYDNLLSGVLSSEYSSSIGLSSSEAIEEISYLGSVEQIKKDMDDWFKKNPLGAGVNEVTNTVFGPMEENDQIDALLQYVEPTRLNVNNYIDGMVDFFAGGKASQDDLDSLPVLIENYKKMSSFESDSDKYNVWLKENYWGKALSNTWDRSKKLWDLVTKMKSVTAQKVNLLLTLQSQSDEFVSFLERSRNFGDAGYNVIANRYINMMTEAIDVDGTAIEGAMIGLANYLTDYGIKQLSKKAKTVVLKSVYGDIFYGSSGANIAHKLRMASVFKKVALTYGIADALDDYIGGYKKSGEKLAEQEYLVKIESIYKQVYADDITKYNMAPKNSEMRNEYAKQVFYDLDMIRRVKLYSNEHALKIFTYLYDDTLAGYFSKYWNPGADPTVCVTELYNAYADALINMKLINCPIYNISFESADKIQVYEKNGRPYAVLFKDGNRGLTIPELDMFTSSGFTLLPGQTLELLCDLSMGNLTTQGNNKISLFNGCKLSVTSMDVKGNLEIQTAKSGGNAELYVYDYVSADGLTLGSGINARVDGSVYIRQCKADDKGYYHGLVMNGSEGNNLFIGGDLTIDAYPDANWQSNYGVSALNTGSLELQGNMTVLYSRYYTANNPLVISPEFTFIFSGEEQHCLDFEMPVSFGKVAVNGPGFTTPDEEFKYADIYIDTLETDLDIASKEITLSINNCNGKTITAVGENRDITIGELSNVENLTIKGDVTQVHLSERKHPLLEAAVTLANSGVLTVDGSYTVSGNLNVPEGQYAISINGGKMYVSGDFISKPGKTSRVHMNNAAGMLCVGGNLSLSANDGYYQYDPNNFELGTVEVTGDIKIDIKAAVVSDSFNFVLNGEEVKNVDAYQISLGRVTVKCPAIDADSLTAYSLASDLVVTGEDRYYFALCCANYENVQVSAPNVIFLNNMDIHGRLTANCEIVWINDSGIVSKDAEIIINGDAYAEMAEVTLDGKMSIAGDFTIRGVRNDDFIVNSEAELLVGGSIDFYQADLIIYNRAMINGGIQIAYGNFWVSEDAFIVAKGDVYTYSYDLQGVLFIGGSLRKDSHSSLETAVIAKYERGLSLPSEWEQEVGTTLCIPFFIDGYEMLSDPTFVISENGVLDYADDGIICRSKGEEEVIVRVAAKDLADGSITELTKSVRVSIQSIPDAPKLRVNDASCFFANIVWDGIYDADLYNIYKLNASGEIELWSETGSLECTLGTYDGIAAGKTYTVYVSAVNRYGESEKTELAVKVPEHILVYDQAVPPTNDSDGLTMGAHCVVCCESIMKQRQVTKAEIANQMNIAAYNVELSGYISLNFYLSVPEDIDINSFSASFVVDGVVQDAAKIEMVELKEGAVKGIFYKCSCDLAAAQMADEVKVRFLYGGELYKESAGYSVKGYSKQFFEDADGIYSEHTKDIVRAMLNYGGYAQQYFSNDELNAENLVNYGLYEGFENPISSVEKEQLRYSNARVDGELSGVTYVGNSLVLDGKLKMRWYFTADDSVGLDTVKCTVNDKQAEIQKKENICYIECADITVGELSDSYTVCVSDGSGKTMMIEAGPYAYLYNAIDSEEEILSNVCKALYLFSRTLLN